MTEQIFRLDRYHAYRHKGGKNLCSFIFINLKRNTARPSPLALEETLIQKEVF